jgi:Berberine and berberine like
VDHNMSIDAVWLPEQDDTVGSAEPAWAREFLAALEPHRAGVYVNFLDSDDDTSRVREAYGDANYRRLVEVKAKYDPENMFRNNKNIQPTTVLDATSRASLNESSGAGGPRVTRWNRAPREAAGARSSE